MTDLSYVNLKWLLDKLYKPLICNEFIYGKTRFYAFGAMFAYEKGVMAAGRGRGDVGCIVASGLGLI